MPDTTTTNLFIKDGGGNIQVQMQMAAIETLL